jgi:hypothetical protein
MSTAVSTITTPVTVILGDLPGWYPRLVYRTTEPIPVAISPDGRFLTLTVRGEQRVGAIVTPEGHPEPVVYLGGELPPQPWTDEEGWQPADMPQGVGSEVVETDVVALSWHDGELVGYCATVWLDRSYRHLERFDLPVREADATSQVGCRVLEALTLRAPFNGSGGPLRALNVVVDDISAFRAAGWQAVDWLDFRANVWGRLYELSHCLESVAYPLLGEAVLSEVIVHDLVALNPDDLSLLPSDVRNGLECALLTMPD